MRYGCRALLLMWPFLSALGQEPTFMEAGTHPGSRQLYQRLLLTYAPDQDPQTVTEIKTAYGINARLAVLPEFAVNEDGDVDGSLRIKQRIWQQDSGPIDTWRASVQAGIA